MCHRSVFLLPICLAVAVPAQAQSEAALRDYFEGKSVRVKIDMPATQQGIDVYPDARRAINFDEYGNRIKTSGISIKSGESVVVTRVRLKDKIIEFHLGGGGYGTFGDDSSGSVYAASTPKSNREKDLEKLVRSEKDAARKKQLQRELDDLRSAREREDARNRAASSAASEAKKTRIAESRLHSGSRFNIRYQEGIPPGLSPDGVIRALAEYVDFPFASDAQPQEAKPGVIRKGMTLSEVDAALGRPEKTAERSEGTLKVVTAFYSRNDQRITAEFVEGVLIKYAISSK